jgi:hypothetical protein
VKEKDTGRGRGWHASLECGSKEGDTIGMLHLGGDGPGLAFMSFNHYIEYADIPKAEIHDATLSLHADYV